MREDERDRVSRQGTEAWRRLKREKNWNDWIKVGEALQVGREWAMNQAGIPVGTNRKPEGKAYNMAFGEWLQRYKLHDMDKGDRSRLFAVMDNLPQIEAWRQTLTLTERLKLNHPNAVLRKWKAAFEPEKPKGEAKPTLRDSVVTLEEENAAKERRIVELEERLQEAEAAASTSPSDAEMERLLADAILAIDKCFRSLGSGEADIKHLLSPALYEWRAQHKAKSRRRKATEVPAERGP